MYVRTSIDVHRTVFLNAASLGALLSWRDLRLGIVALEPTQARWSFSSDVFSFCAETGEVVDISAWPPLIRGPITRNDIANGKGRVAGYGRKKEMKTNYPPMWAKHFPLHLRRILLKPKILEKDNTTEGFSCS